MFREAAADRPQRKKILITTKKDWAPTERR